MLADGRGFRSLIVLDDFPRMRLALIADTGLGSHASWPRCPRRGARPLLYISDNNTDPTSESFNGRLPGECLNETPLTSPRQARGVGSVAVRLQRDEAAFGARRSSHRSRSGCPPCSPASRPLRAGFADGLQPSLPGPSATAERSTAEMEERRSNEQINHC